MANLKILEIISISFLALIVSCGDSRSTKSTKLKMSDQELNETIYRYLSIYDEIDQKVVNEYFRIVHENANIFNYLTDAETDPELLPYLEKYSKLKMQYKNQPINTDVKVLFSTNPLKSTDHLNNMEYSGYCSFFTRVVFIDRGFWEAHKGNERVKESLLFHELGHCDLDRKHFRLHEDFSSYIEIGNYSFMNGDIVYSLLFDLINRDIFPSNDIYNIYSQQIEEAKEDLGQTFIQMYQELFSKENTRDNVECKADGTCVEIPQEQTGYGFESQAIPILTHTTIGPSQGDGVQDIIIYVRLQYICYSYNNSNYEPLNDYLEEQGEITEEEIVEYCQLNEFNNHQLL